MGMMILLTCGGSVIGYLAAGISLSDPEVIGRLSLAINGVVFVAWLPSGIRRQLVAACMIRLFTPKQHHSVPVDSGEAWATTAVFVSELRCPLTGRLRATCVCELCLPALVKVDATAPDSAPLRNDQLRSALYSEQLSVKWAASQKSERAEELAALRRSLRPPNQSDDQVDALPSTLLRFKPSSLSQNLPTGRIIGRANQKTPIQPQEASPIKRSRSSQLVFGPARRCA